MGVVLRMCVCFSMLAILAGCMPPLTGDQARATAVAGGCWPYGYHQPVTPAPRELPRAGTPTPHPYATVVAYPGCTPLPQTPTATVRPTLVPTPAPRPTPPPPALQGGRTLIGQRPGMVSPWGRATRSPTLAVSPQDGRAMVAWLNWGGGSDVYAGDVWVRVQGQSRAWQSSMTLNPAPVKSFFGGLGATWTVSNTLVVAYGGGGFADDTQIYVASSADAGLTWGRGLPIGIRGRVVSVASDVRGAVYILALVRGPTDAQSGEPVLIVWSPEDPTWRVSPPIVPRIVGGGALSVTPLPDGQSLVSAVLSTYDPPQRSTVVVAHRRTGDARWIIQDVTDEERRGPGVVVASSIVGGLRPDGSVVLAVAWSQTPGPGPAAGLVQVRVSRDGGATWGPATVLAQHNPTMRFTDDPTVPALVGGFEPSLVYDLSTDSLMVSWIEDDLGRTEDRQRSITDRSVRTFLAALRVGRDDDWLFRVVPDQTFGSPPALTAWGQRGALWSDPLGQWHWLTIIDERNRQAQILAEPIRPAASVVEGAP